MTTPVAFLSVTYNNRPSLPVAMQSIFDHTSELHLVTWYMVLQNCTDSFVQHIQDLCKSKVKLVLIRLAKNVGLSQSLSYLIHAAKAHEFTICTEDDWIIVDEFTPGNKWISACLQFMENNPNVSTLFLRGYSCADEERRYGFSAPLQYRCFKHKDNFNYAKKIADANITVTQAPVSADQKPCVFKYLPDFLMTWNPCFCRNEDYWTWAYPIPVMQQDQKADGANEHWGWVEGLQMEKIRHLKCFYMPLFGHFEDFFPAAAAEIGIFPGKATPVPNE